MKALEAEEERIELVLADSSCPDHHRFQVHWRCLFPYLFQSQSRHHCPGLLPRYPPFPFLLRYRSTLQQEAGRTLPEPEPGRGLASVAPLALAGRFPWEGRPARPHQPLAS